MGVVTHRITDLPRRPRRRILAPLLRRTVFVVLVWLPVVVVEARNLPSQSFVAALVVPMELAVWLMAITITVWVAGRGGGRLVAAGCFALLAALCVHFTNWSAFHPQSYYATHRYAFDAVADEVRGGTLGTSSADDGATLPWYLRDLSTTGRAAVVGEHEGRPVVFLPQRLGAPDDAGGYAFLDGGLGVDVGDDVQVDLFGHPLSLSSGIDLGDGWWYVPGR